MDCHKNQKAKNRNQLLTGTFWFFLFGSWYLVLVIYSGIFSAMIRFNTTILKFDQQGEKTGWTYILIPAKTAQKLKPGNKKSFRVKGLLDELPISGVSLIPMGAGDFIMAINAAMRKGTGKRKGDQLKVQLEEDKKQPEMSEELMLCLEEEPAALQQFNSLAGSHRNYFSKWIDSAKTVPTRARRIALAIEALLAKKDFGQMLRDDKKKRNEF